MNPSDEIGLAQVTTGDGHHDLHDLWLLRFQCPSVDIQKDRHGDEANALVAVHIAVPACQALAARGRKGSDVGPAVISPQVARPRQRRLDEVLVPHAPADAESLGCDGGLTTLY